MPPPEPRDVAVERPSPTAETVWPSGRPPGPSSVFVVPLGTDPESAIRSVWRDGWSVAIGLWDVLSVVFTFDSDGPGVLVVSAICQWPLTWLIDWIVYVPSLFAVPRSEICWLALKPAFSNVALPSCNVTVLPEMSYAEVIAVLAGVS